ncbi:LuxR C-terminal-related transcriptional regulator [Streptomyces sp. TR02-1]|uniref:helix-turn-helix transcriptional regulator n=1 Tax=Streptomyces sp. TR02-1 TaxID=3385977 RepID=UPI0039A35516
MDAVEQQAVRAALIRVLRGSGAHVAFAGLCGAEGSIGFRIGEGTGTRTSALRGLTIAPGSGLGGKAAARARPVSVTDYRTSRGISHEYDAAVAAEGLRSVLALPVMAGSHVRGVLYAALRCPAPLGDRATDAAAEAVRELERALDARRQARRAAASRRSLCEAGGAPGPDAWEEVRAAHSDLRSVAARLADEEVRREVLEVCDRLAAAPLPDRLRAPGTAREVRLSPRETDVVAWVADGGTNAEIAARAGLRPETVKAYLRSAMRKLDTHTRLETVVAARRAGLVP